MYYSSAYIPSTEELLLALIPILLAFGLAIAMMIAWCKLFHKAGLPWERQFVPVYGQYWMYKFVGAKWIFWTYLLASAGMLTAMIAAAAVNPYEAEAFLGILTIAFVALFLVLYCIYCVKLSRAFGHGGGFAFGLIVLPVIFVLVLGFGKSEYQMTLPE